MSNINDIIAKMQNVFLDGDKGNIINYINSLNINDETKQLLIEFIKNDNYNNYEDIYNICLENDIELPPPEM